MTKHDPIPEGIRPDKDAGAHADEGTTSPPAITDDSAEKIRAALSATRARLDHTSGLRDQLQLELDHLLIQAQGLNDRRTSITAEGERREGALEDENRLRLEAIEAERERAVEWVRAEAERRRADLEREMEARMHTVEVEINERLERLRHETANCEDAIRVTQAALDSLEGQ